MNKYENINIKNIEDEVALFDELLEKVEKLKEYEFVRIFAKAELTENIIRNFLSLSEYSIGLLDFDGFCGDYKDEYVIAINKDKEVYCEKARFIKNGKCEIYNYDDKCICYVFEDDVKQDIIDKLLDNRCEIVLFGFGENDNFEIEESDENDMKGFTISNCDENCYSHYSFYSNCEDIVKQEYERLKKLN